MKNEVYIILKNDVCNDTGSISIEEVACGLDVARKLFKKHIKQIKSDCDFDNLPFAESDCDYGLQ